MIITGSQHKIMKVPRPQNSDAVLVTCEAAGVENVEELPAGFINWTLLIRECLAESKYEIASLNIESQLGIGIDQWPGVQLRVLEIMVVSYSEVQHHRV